MSDDYSRGYAAGLRELDHGLSYAEVERLREERDNAEKMRGEWQDAYWSLHKKYNELESGRDKLRECLKFYADETNYEEVDAEYVPTRSDRGERARTILSQLEGESK